jgi:hypothetical protein
MDVLRNWPLFAMSMPADRHMQHRHRVQGLSTMFKKILLLFRPGLARFPKQRREATWGASRKQGGDRQRRGALDTMSSSSSDQCCHVFMAAICVKTVGELGTARHE